VVGDLADRAELRRGEQTAGQLDPEHERPDLRLVVVEAPPLEPDDVLLGHALVAVGDQRRELTEDAERALLLLQPLDRVALEDELPGRVSRRCHGGTLSKVKPLPKEKFWLKPRAGVDRGARRRPARSRPAGGDRRRAPASSVRRR